MVLDGVYAEDEAATLRFHPASGPTDEEMDTVLGTIARRIKRLLARREMGSEEGGGDATLDP